MHAGFSCWLPSLQHTLKLGASTAVDTGELPAFLDQAGGRLLAGGMAVTDPDSFGIGGSHVCGVGEWQNLRRNPGPWR